MKVPIVPVGKGTIYHVSEGSLGCLKTKGHGGAEDVFQGTGRTIRERKRGEVAENPRRTAWGPVYKVGQVARGARGREGSHKAEILRAGAGAPRGLRRRNHNAEAERARDYLLGLSPLELDPSLCWTFQNVFIDILVT